MKIRKKLLILIVISALALQGCAIFRDEYEVNLEVDTTSVGTTAESTTEPTGESAPETEPPAPVIPYSDVSITFTAAGDNLIHPNIYMEAARRATAGEGYNFKPLYEEIAAEIEAADFAFINQETLMADEATFGVSGYPTFNSPQQLGDDLVTLGFDIVGIANNHMLDKSAAGLKSTLDFWHTKPVTLLGAFYDDNDAMTIRTIEKDGVTIALLSYTYGTNGISLPAGSELNIPYISDERITRELAEVEEMADFTIVSVHWGEENTKEPTDEQRRLARLMADGGADVILGHHSHTLLPLEWIDRDDGGRTLCAYSLGNLVSAMMYPENMVGGLLNFTVKGDGVGGLTVGDISFTPTVFYYAMSHFNTHIYRLENYTDEIAAGHGTQIYGYTTTYEKAVTYLKRCFADEYLPEYLR